MDHPTPDLTDTQLTRVIQSCGDFQQALSALTFLLEEWDYGAKYSKVERRKFQCYKNAAIVAFARPFKVGRGRMTLGLHAVGVRLTTAEEKLKDKIIDLRDKVVAHSDDERMHFKISTMQPFDDSPLAIPALVFQESLRLDPAEVDELEALLHKLIHGLTVTIFAIAQSQPERLNVYKLPGN